VNIAPLDRADLRHRLEKALTAFLGGQRGRLAGIDPALVLVADTVENFVRHGKRLRPAFGYWGYRGAGGVDCDEAVAALAALELVQASALIHDDLIDVSDTRRGAPAIHRQFARQHLDGGWGGDPAAFGQAGAILLGDLCLVWSDELLNRCGLPPDTLLRARVDFDEMRTEVTVGQYLDVLNQATADTSVERASTVARYKSAKYTVERPLLFGAALAGAGGSLRRTYSAYGLPLGEAFQLRDDVLGVFGDPSQTGKPAGDDLREGKRTYLVATAFAAADPAQREALRAGLGNPRVDVEALRRIIVDTGALARTERRIEELTEQALRVVRAAVELDREAAEVLIALAGAATNRVR
jgi:geranylgeranyl diphosphate synthase type I